MADKPVKGSTGSEKGERDASVKAASPDPAAAIKGIETVKRMALNAPTAAGIADAMETIEVLAATSPEARTAANEAIRVLSTSAGTATGSRAKPHKAICLSGGGPAVGLHIGALEALENANIEFKRSDSVWALSCIGAWVGVVYNQTTQGSELKETYDFFAKVFRDDRSFDSFPVNTIFAPDWLRNAEALQDFLFDLKNYRDAFLPKQILESFAYTLRALANRENWGKFSEGDFNRWTLNHVLAVHPAVRFLTALAYKSKVNGLTKLLYPDSRLINHINFDVLFKPEKPYIYYNAFNFKSKDIDLFENKRSHGYGNRKMISPESLCACSALPYIEQTVQIDGNDYCEGALVDTVNFKSLLKDHRDSLQEIWINRIVDSHQIRKPENLHDSLANLCQLFAATVGEDDVKLFKYHVRENNRLKKRDDLLWEGTIVEIQVDDHVDFQWSQSNLNKGRANGKLRAEDAVKLYRMYKNKKKTDGVLIIPDDLNDDEIKAAGVDLPPNRQRDAAEAGRVPSY
jgi:predicted acylesterase/phospholipase RssA